MHRESAASEAVGKCREYTSKGYICSEAALRALLDTFEIAWSEKEKAIATIYNRGGAVGDRCGAVEVALLVLSYKYGRLDSREVNLQDRMLSRMLQYKVRDLCGSYFCRELTGAEPGVERNCPKLDTVVGAAAELIFDADELIKKELDKFVV